TSAGIRSVTMDEFCLGSMTSSLAPAELVTAATIPWLPRSGWGFAEVSRRRGDFALVGAMAAIAPDRTTRVAVFGAGAVPQRLPRAEGAAAAGDLLGAERSAAEDIKAQDDIHASAAYRVAVGARLVRRVLTEALGRLDPAA
ncbi:MAG: FAD binding domain-containing protein, partial [Candidatus Dormibacteraceae bacterium]